MCDKEAWYKVYNENKNEYDDSDNNVLPSSDSVETSIDIGNDISVKYSKSIKTNYFSVKDKCVKKNKK